MSTSNSFEKLAYESSRSPYDKLHERLDGHVDRGHGQHFYKCPAHEDKSPSLSIKECDDGTVLVHCFALCSPADIVTAVGLDLCDLFPNDLKPREGKRIRWNFRDLLKICWREALVVQLAGEDLAKNKPLNDTDMERLVIAVKRIKQVVEIGRAA